MFFYSFNNIFFIFNSMKRNLLHYTFPEGLTSIYINGKRYTKKEFNDAQRRQRNRDSKGRFAKKINYIQ